jgi:hypothetical protein
MKEKGWTTIPVLPYISIDATLSFWETLGFAITYRQDRPYKYAVVQRKGCQLHFVHFKSAEDSTAYHGCLIMVYDIEQVYKEFSDSLKAKLGKVPASGLPRISRMKPMQTRFTITDPSGNSVIFIQLGTKDEEDYKAMDQAGLSPLGKSIALAIRLRDFKEDYLAAARTLDNILKKELEGVNKNEYAEALIMSAELARILNDKHKEAQTYERLEKLDIATDKILELKAKHVWQVE